MLHHDYFDVRLEIVDHLSAHIEEQSAQNPELRFYTALNHSIDTFGGKKGMRKLERNKTYEYWRSFLLDHLRAFGRAFQVPQAFFSIIFLLITYQFFLLTSFSTFWIFILCCLLTGVMESIERYRNSRVNKGLMISSFPIYTRSAWVTNTPLILLLFTNHSWFDLGWWADPRAAFAVFTYLLFFIFKFHYLQKGIKKDYALYTELHNQLYNLSS